MPRPEDGPRAPEIELTEEQMQFLTAPKPQEWVDGAPYYEWTAKPFESGAEFNARMEAKGSLERMRDGCNYVEIAGSVCRKCGEVHGELPVPLLMAAARRNVQAIRNKAREAAAADSKPTQNLTVIRTCDVLMSDLDLLAADIGASDLGGGKR